MVHSFVFLVVTIGSPCYIPFRLCMVPVWLFCPIRALIVVPVVRVCGSCVGVSVYVVVRRQLARMPTTARSMFRIVCHVCVLERAFDGIFNAIHLSVHCVARRVFAPHRA